MEIHDFGELLLSLQRFSVNMVVPGVMPYISKKGEPTGSPFLELTSALLRYKFRQFCIEKYGKLLCG